MEFQFTAIAIAAVANVVVALFFAYFPTIRVWFASLEIDKQSLIKLGFMVLIEGIIAGLSFVPGVLFLKPPFTLAEAGAVAIALIITNQPVANMLPQLKDVREAIVRRMQKFFR